MIQNGHVKFGYNVLAYVFFPGFIYGWYRNFAFGDAGLKHTLRALVFPFWFVPYSIKTLFLAIFEEEDVSGDKKEKAK